MRVALIDFKCFAINSRSILCLVMACITATLSACVSIPDNLQQSISWRGAHLTKIIRFGSNFFISTASILPGEKRSIATKMQITACSDENHQISIFVRSERDGSLERSYCNNLLAATKWVLKRSGISSSRFSYDITLVPVGYAYSKSRSRLQSNASLSLYYAFPLDQYAIKKSIAAGSTSIAHETFHVASAVLGVRRSVQDDEFLAYRVGACAQFAATGFLAWEDLQRADLMRQGLGGNAGISSSIGAATAHSFSKYFDDTGVVLEGSRLGDELTGSCEELMRSAFE
jgi:hypothetical protein